MYNKRSLWVASCVLNHPSAPARAKALKTFIHLATLLGEVHNFFSCFAIVSGLGLGPVYRLKQSWKLLAVKDQQKYNTLAALTSTLRNSLQYRQAHRAGLGRAMVPHLAIMLKDCFQVEETVPTFDKQNRIRFAKFAKQWECLSQIQQCQQMPFHFKEFDALCSSVLASASDGERNVEDRDSGSFLQFSFSATQTVDISVLMGSDSSAASRRKLAAQRIVITSLERAVETTMTHPQRVMDDNQLWERSWTYEPRRKPG
jgi:hypothetical protein